MLIIIYFQNYILGFFSVSVKLLFYACKLDLIRFTFMLTSCMISTHRCAKCLRLSGSVLMVRNLSLHSLFTFFARKAKYQPEKKTVVCK